MDTTPFLSCMPWGSQILTITTTLEANHYLGCAREQLPSARGKRITLHIRIDQESMKDK